MWLSLRAVALKRNLIYAAIRRVQHLISNQVWNHRNSTDDCENNLFFLMKRWHYINPNLACPHSLPGWFRIDFKILLITLNSSGSAHRYTAERLSQYEPVYSLLKPSDLESSTWEDKACKVLLNHFSKPIFIDLLLCKVCFYSIIFLFSFLLISIEFILCDVVFLLLLLFLICL